MAGRMITKADLLAARQGSYYTILGCGGPLEEWPKQIEPLMEEAGIGRPSAWYHTTGAEVNEFAEQGGYRMQSRDLFPPDLQILMFPLDGLNGGKLAMFKIQMEDRWFDDIIDNMHARAGKTLNF
jgi:hypothetical protein